MYHTIHPFKVNCFQYIQLYNHYDNFKIFLPPEKETLSLCISPQPFPPEISNIFAASMDLPID